MGVLKNKFLFTIAMGGMALACFAQNNDKEISSEDIRVVKEYVATIQDAQKVNLQPNIPDIEETRPKLDYSVPNKELRDFAYEPGPMKPISIGQEKFEKYNTSYIKLGFGTQLNPLAQLAYNDNKSKNLKFGLFYNHISMAAYKNKLQKFSDDEIGVYARYAKKVEIGGGFTFHNYRTHFFGIDTSFYGSDTSFRAKDVRQVFRTYDVNAHFKNAQKNKANINYSQTVQFNYLQETFGRTGEWFIAGKTNLDKRIGKLHTVYGRFDLDISHFNNKSDPAPLKRGIFTPTLGYGFNNDDWRGYAHFGIAIFSVNRAPSVNDASRVMFVTDIHLQKRLYMDNLIAFVGYERRYQKNSLNTLIHTNNFIQSNIRLLNSPVDNFKAGIKGTISNFSYNAAFNLVRIKNFALFVNDSADPKRFAVTYDPNTWIYNAHFEAGYNTKEWLRLLLMGDVNLYDLQKEARPWHEPVFRMTVRANYAWKNKLIVGADVYFISSTFARVPASDGLQKKLKGTADINLNAEYIFSKHLGFFASVNNLLHIKYQRWNNYRSFGINGVVGAKYSF